MSFLWYIGLREQCVLTILNLWLFWSVSQSGWGFHFPYEESGRVLLSSLNVVLAVCNCSSYLYLLFARIRRKLAGLSLKVKNHTFLFWYGLVVAQTVGTDNKRERKSSYLTVVVTGMFSWIAVVSASSVFKFKAKPVSASGLVALKIWLIELCHARWESVL